METRGRKKKTVEQKKLEGTDRKDRDGLAIAADMSMPKHPSWLDADEVKIWKRLAPRLNKMGVLSNTDAESFGLFCFWMNKFLWLKRECTNDIGSLKKAMSEIDRLGAKFGYTPADRAGLKVEGTEKEDPLDSLINRRKKIKIG
jgi:phage terminase small subunit